MLKKTIKLSPIERLINQSKQLKQLKQLKQPKQPKQPIQPIQPTQPTQPKQPIQPTQPTQPKFINTQEINNLEYNFKEKLKHIFKSEIKTNKIIELPKKNISTKKQNKLILNNNDTFINYENIDDVNIILCTCVHGRKKLTYIVMKYLSEMKFSKIIVSYSDKIDYENLLNISSKIIFVKSNNNPISLKWNNAVNKCKEYPHDAIMITGNDDIISPYYLDKCKLYIKNNFDYISNNKWLSYLVEYNLIFNSRYINRVSQDGLGAGRVIHKNILEKYNYNIYNFHLNKGLDGSSFNIFKSSIKKIVYDIYPNSIICITLLNDRIGITTTGKYTEYIKKYYRNDNTITTIDNVTYLF